MDAKLVLPRKLTCTGNWVWWAWQPWQHNASLCSESSEVLVSIMSFLPRISALLLVIAIVFEHGTANDERRHSESSSEIQLSLPHLHYVRILCKALSVPCCIFPQLIGWREDALKMVFLVTDQNYHSAGDGKVLEFALLLNCSHDSTVYNYISFPP